MLLSMSWRMPSFLYLDINRETHAATVVKESREAIQIQNLSGPTRHPLSNDEITVKIEVQTNRAR